MEQESSLFQRYRQAHRLLYLPLAAETVDIIPVSAESNTAQPSSTLGEGTEPQNTGQSRRKGRRRKRPRQQPSTVVQPQADLEVDTPTVDFGILPFWDDVEFCYREARTRDVKLVGDFTQWTQQPVPMVWDGETFRTRLSLADGRYLYRFQVDGRDIVDPQNPSRVAITAHGVASVLDVQRWRRTIHVMNHRETPVTLTARLAQSWLRVTPTVQILKELASADLCLEVDHVPLNPGEHAGRIELLSSLQADPVATVTVRVDLRQHGLVLRPFQSAIDLGLSVRGERRMVPLAFEVLGDDLHANAPEVRIYNHSNAQLYTVQLQPVSESAIEQRQCFVPVDLGSLPRVVQGSCRLSIDTQGYLWNRRFYEVVLHYQLLFLKKRPPRLHFRRFDSDGTQTLMLHLTRSDGLQPHVDIEFPAALDGRLKAQRVTQDTWQFQVHQHDFPSGERVEGILRLADQREAGCTDHIRVIVEG